MHDAAHLVRGLVVVGRAASLDAAALIDGDVDDHAALLHRADDLLGHELRRRGARDEHRPDDEVGPRDHFFDVRRVGVERLDRAAEDVLEVGHRVGADVEHGHLRAHPDRDGRRVAPDDAAAEDDHAAAPRARDAAEQDALAAALLLEERRADLDGHAPGDLAHGPEQRQRAVVELDGLVGNRGDAALRELLGELGRGREVQVRVEHEAFAQEAVLDVEGLLDLDDELGPPSVCSGGDDGRPLRHVLGVGDAAAFASAGLDQHAVPARREQAHAGRGHPHPVLARLDLFGYADNHTSTIADRPRVAAPCAPPPGPLTRGSVTLYSSVLRPLLFAVAPDTAHAAAMAALAPVEHLAPLRALVRSMAAPRDARIVVRVMGLEFPSPVGLAGGFDKNAHRPRALAALGFGHVELGTVTALAQAANPKPNMFRLPADRALINRLGFPNEGAARVAARIARVRGAVGVPIGVSIGKSRAVPADDLAAVVADYEASFDAVRPVADFVVVNVSSPNTAGLRGMQAHEQAHALLSSLAKRGDRTTLLVKIAPDLDDAQIDDVLSVVDEVGLAGVVATNTTIGRGGLATAAKDVEAIGAGGLSGAPLRARALEVVGRVRRRLGQGAVVVGVGGVEEAEHAMALIRAGANLVQMYTGFVYGGPGTAARIARGLGEMVTREGAGGIGEMVGAG